MRQRNARVLPPCDFLTTLCCALQQGWWRVVFRVWRWPRHAAPAGRVAVAASRARCGCPPQAARAFAGGQLRVPLWASRFHGCVRGDSERNSEACCGEAARAATGCAAAAAAARFLVAARSVAAAAGCAAAVGSPSTAACETAAKRRIRRLAGLWAAVTAGYTARRCASLS